MAFQMDFGGEFLVVVWVANKLSQVKLSRNLFGLELMCKIEHEP